MIILRGLFLLPGFIFTAVLAQAQYKVRGTVLDRSSNVVEYANVSLFADSALVSAGATDSFGMFAFDSLAPRSYKLTVNYFGSEDKWVNIALTKDTALTVTLDSLDNELKGVEVIARKPLIERKVDRLVFNVENSVAASGGDALDALRVTPKIKVQNEQVSMIGKSGMMVLINEKPLLLSGDDLIAYLKTIRSEDIKSIEVITNPPAKYSAEGNSGIVNIVLKRTKSNSWNGTVIGVLQQSKATTGNVGLGFNYQKDKLSVSSGISYTNGATKPVETNAIYYPGQLRTEENNRIDYANNIGARLGFEYKFTDKLSAGIQFTGTRSSPGMASKGLVNFMNYSSAVDSLTLTDAIREAKGSYNSVNFNTVYLIDSLKRKLTFNIDHFNYGNTGTNTVSSYNYLSNGTVIPNSFYGADFLGEQAIKNTSFNIDMEHPFDAFNLNYGGRISFSETNNSFEAYDRINDSAIFNPLQSNVFKYNENIQALYLSGNKKLTEKLEVQMGLRVENTQTLGYSKTLNQTTPNNYLRYFPTGYLNYAPTEEHNFSANYGRRISRPPFHRLNPFRRYDNPYSYSEGNPFLSPSFSNNLEFNYTFKNNWDNGLYFSRLNDGYGQITLLEDNIQKVLAENYHKGWVIGLSESYTFNKFKFWTSINSFDINYAVTNSLVPELLSRNAGFNYYFSTSNDFVLNSKRTLFFNLSYWLSYDEASDLYTNTPHSQLNATLKYLLLNQKLQLIISGNDILRTNRPIYTSYTDNIKISYRNYYDIRNVRIALVYRFGNTNLSEKARNAKNTEEQQRLN